MFMRLLIPAFICGFLFAGCAPAIYRQMEATAYCPCGECNDYTRGSARFLKLDFWNRTVSKGARKGQPYTGKTASGDELRAPNPGLASADSVRRPWTIPGRVLLPWRALPAKGTIAADTDYYPFGTEMYVPGWGWGVVEDRGGAIKGPDRIDLYFASHRQTVAWGRQRVMVKIRYPQGR